MVHFAPALVGTPDPAGTTRRERSTLRAAKRKRAGKPARKHAARRRTCRHLVFLAAGTVQLARLAGKDRGTWKPSALLRAGDGFDISSSGGAHDHVEPALHRQGSVPHVYINASCAMPKARRCPSPRQPAGSPCPDRRHPCPSARQVHGRACCAATTSEDREVLRTHYPVGIPAFGADALRSLRREGDVCAHAQFDSGAARVTATSATSCGTRRAFVLMNTEGRIADRTTTAPVTLSSWIAGSSARCNAPKRKWRTGSTVRFDNAAGAIYRSCGTSIATGMSRSRRNNSQG